MPLTHKSSPYMKRYRLPSLKITSSNVRRSQYYDDLSSPEEEESEKILSQILKSKKEFDNLKTSLIKKDISNNVIDNSSISLVNKKEEEKIVKNFDNKCNNNSNNNNNNKEPLKIEIEKDGDNKKIGEIQKVIQNEIVNLERRFKELELLMKF
ncbi:Hypothetical protein SRAE_2000519700 [Strongyloides ratti]|uniref:Uncharacterized protein n=1 Tax=Strongyloides ratti TaxID=34506 RepID=A0A090LL74_STRRB|nr:Hypothetical protein SRAE_2000519700 [Strongyloides ratti]CEF70569.1 Hypothetical protein SRAE_2000519700 [Strongyloides ratti]